MKKVLSVLLVVVSGIVFGQSEGEIQADSIPWEFRKQAFVYNSAKLFNDPIVARTALYNMLAQSPGNVALYDSLAISYLQYSQYASAALVAQQALQIDPRDQFAMEIAATSLETLGAKDKALDNYEGLYLANQDINILYKIAFLQMEVKRYSEASNSVNIILEDPESEKNTIGFPTSDGVRQNVTLKAAANRVQAMILQDQGDIEGAKAKYLEVLEMQPGFQIVQQQLRELTKSGGE